MDSVRGKWALVTGASSGFGVEFATLLAARKANLVLAARRAEPMERLAAELRRSHGVDVVVERIDLTAPGSAAELKTRLDARGIAVDVLVNNAGRGLYGSFVEQPLETALDLLRLNVLTMTELTHVFAAEMMKRRAGHILLIASVLGHQPTPGSAVYAASKAYVRLLGEALHDEMKPYGVGVTVLSPGFTATSFGEVAGQPNTLAVRLLTMQPHPVARAGIEAMLGRRPSVVAGLRNKLVVFSNRLTPGALQRARMMRVVASSNKRDHE